MAITSSSIAEWDDVIFSLAKKRGRIVGVEVDDLVQEGRFSILLCLLGDIEPSEQDIKNTMRRYINAQKKQSHVTYDVRTQ